MNATKQQWKELFDAAAAFKKAACWEWMSNSHIFGVQDPQSGEIGYCCIMGNGGEMFGMTLNLGTRGLEGLLSMFSEGRDSIFSQYCLMLSFDDRDELYPEEHKHIKELGLSFRGAKAWPTFRLYEPGYVPWPIATEEQVRFMSFALQQAVIMSLNVKSDPDAIYDLKGNTFLTRVAEETADGLVWTDQWLEPKESEADRMEEASQIHELRLAKAKKSIQGRAGVWEIDSFYAPMPVDEGGERPFYPKMGLIVDQATGQILKVVLSERAKSSDELADQFLNVMEQLKVVPSAVWAVDERVLPQLRQLLAAFEIEAFLVSEAPALEEAKEGMMNYFMNGSMM